MIDVGLFENCVCVRRGTPSDSCEDRLVLQEKGKKVTLRTRTGEEAKMLVIDGCVIRDNQPKCDGVFLYRRNNLHWLILVELKGSDIPHAFEQLAYMRTSRREYNVLKSSFMASQTGNLKEEAFIISNHTISRVDQQKMERQWNVRIKAILHSEPTTPIPDLREYLNR